MFSYFQNVLRISCTYETLLSLAQSQMFELGNGRRGSKIFNHRKSLMDPESQETNALLFAESRDKTAT